MISGVSEESSSNAYIMDTDVEAVLEYMEIIILTAAKDLNSFKRELSKPLKINPEDVLMEMRGQSFPAQE